METERQIKKHLKTNKSFFDLVMKKLQFHLENSQWGEAKGEIHLLEALLSDCQVREKILRGENSPDNFEEMTKAFGIRREDNL